MIMGIALFAQISKAPVKVMIETQALIERVRRVSDQHQRIALAVDPAVLQIKPGQSLLVRVDADRWHPYLREHWWPVTIENSLLVIERPAGIHYIPGTIINLLSPVGNPFRFRRTLRNVLLLAFDTDPTPLLMTIPVLLANQVSVTLLLLGSASRYMTEHLPPEVEILRSDDDTMKWQNRVTTVGWADQVLVTVAPDDEMERFRQIWQLFAELRAEIPANYLFGVFNPVLPCGVGACGACLLRTKDGASVICVEGPAVDLTKVGLQA